MPALTVASIVRVGPVPAVGLSAVQLPSEVSISWFCSSVQLPHASEWTSLDVLCVLVLLFFFSLHYLDLNSGPTPWATPPALFL
jgi:hypothetical protein